ncbi:thioredoxin domain-containing protein [Candidatus Dojkabacteria bacterium]|nr:thioredoxin domain-containing protein [Candidatus Dojkabacteria bacterium]
MESIKDNMALIITIVATLIIGAIGVVALSTTDTKPIPESERAELLVRDDSHVAGDFTSKITVVEFSDFECPACGYYAEEFNRFKQDYEDRVRIVYRQFPLESIHPLAFKAAEASEAAAAQNKFWEYHDILFANQSIWGVLSEEKAIEAFIGYAEEIGVEDLSKFAAELKEGVYKSKVQKDLDDAKALKLPGTPSILVNGVQIENPSYENLSNEIERLLAE